MVNVCELINKSSLTYFVVFPVFGFISKEGKRKEEKKALSNIYNN